MRMRVNYFCLEYDPVVYKVPDSTDPGKMLRCVTAYSVRIWLPPKSVSVCCKGLRTGSFELEGATMDTGILVEVRADLTHDPTDPANPQRVEVATQTLKHRPEQIHPALCFPDLDEMMEPLSSNPDEAYYYGVIVNGTRLQADGTSAAEMGMLEEIGEKVARWLATLHWSLNSQTVVEASLSTANSLG